MTVVRGCNLPDDLLYDVENHTWFSEMPDGRVKLGMTTVATALAGEIVAFTPKKVGRSVGAGKSVATIESGKWVGPAKSAAAGEVVEVNDAMTAKPSTANADPYDAGWLVILQPEDWASVKPTLTPGSAVAAPYEAKMDADGFAGCEAA
ncbi:MAG: glycine cleavage system protein H [Sphingomonadales bacterium]|nr:glycine cleavage system protein H [Sphingomonadales bacterium]MBD3772681.1 glycine cleavage system protein H [Paracoccaceae bacterium]